MICPRIVEFLCCRDIANLALACRRFETIVKRSVCWDEVRVFAHQISDMPRMRMARCAVRGISTLPVQTIPNNVLVTSFEFTVHFNKPLVTLPQSLVSIAFGKMFNQPLPQGILPPLLKSIIFGERFNQVLAHGTFPPFVEHIEFCGDVPQLLPNFFPTTLKFLKMTRCHQKLTRGILPESLESIVLEQYDFPIDEDGVFPNNLLSLTFGDNFYQRIDFLPCNLKSFVLGKWLNEPMTATLPPSLQHLSVGDHPIEQNFLPQSLLSIEFGFLFNRTLMPGVLPHLLTSLVFGYNFNQFLAPGVLPPALENLRFEDCFNQPIGKDVLPSSLRKLSFGYMFGQRFDQGCLPESLESLSFGNSDYDQFLIPPEILPRSLRYLSFGWAPLNDIYEKCGFFKNHDHV
jgi:hypothetical protein